MLLGTFMYNQMLPRVGHSIGGDTAGTAAGDKTPTASRRHPALQEPQPLFTGQRDGLKNIASSEQNRLYARPSARLGPESELLPFLFRCTRGLIIHCFVEGTQNQDPGDQQRVFY